MEEGHMMRIVLLGKTGSGKSSLANTIHGENVFNKSGSANSVTKKCEARNRRINEREIGLVDTPGVFDTDLNSTELTSGILKCIEECAPGPHAFLVVLKVERFTKQEQEVVDIILKNFSKDALKYTTVVFTHGNQLEEGKRIEEWVRENESLRNLVDKCGGRCHVFDNKYWNNSQHQYRNNQVQVQELLETIEQTVRENGGGFFPNWMRNIWGNIRAWLWNQNRETLGYALFAAGGLAVLIGIAYVSYISSANASAEGIHVATNQIQRLTDNAQIFHEVATLVQHQHQTCHKQLLFQ